VPIIYITLAVLIVLDLAYLAPWTSGIGYLIVLTGIPAYFIWKRSAASRPASTDTDGLATEEG
jgi:APA family basic amino acid/polyamine antiporter